MSSWRTYLGVDKVSQRELLTHTKRRDFLWCPRYFFHRHEQRLELIARKPGRRRCAIFSDALQAARDSYEEAGASGAAPDGYDVTEATGEALSTISGAYIDLLGTGEIGDQEDADTLEVEEAKMEVLVPEYIDRYGLKPRREVEFYLPLVYPITKGRSTKFDVAGKLDGMEVIGHRMARVIEDKLVAQIQRPMIERLPLDAQSSEYIDALEQRGWQGEVAYRHTRWPGINPKPEKVLKTITHRAETLDEFQHRLREDIRERNSFYFDEQILVFPREHLADYRLGRWGTARMIREARTAARQHSWQEAYPMNPTRCWEFGGCEFIPLCCKQEDAIDRYRIREEDPELSLKREEAHATT
jgi:hypothetical protein